MERVTYQDIRSMEVGETKVFALPTPESVESAGVTAYRFGRMYGFKMKCVKNYKARTITITKRKDESESSVD